MRFQHVLYRFVVITSAMVFLIAPEVSASITVGHTEKTSSEKRSSTQEDALLVLLGETEEEKESPEIASPIISEKEDRSIFTGKVELTFLASGKTIEAQALSALLDEIEGVDDVSEVLIDFVDPEQLASLPPQNKTPSMQVTPPFAEDKTPLIAPIEKEITYDVPVIKNKQVKKYIKLFQTRLRPQFEKWLSRSGRYTELMHDILREYELPEDLVYVALIESGFNPKAFSRARAAGPWQFIKGTGKKYGLRIDRWVDERRDPVKATHAAARYLKDLYNMFGSWPLALASYNAGEGRISRAIRRTKTKDFWELRKSRIVRRETKNYVPKFMAATIIAKDPERYRFSVSYQAPWKFEEVEIEKATYLSSIAKHAGVSIKEIKRYNPEIKRDVTPPQAPGYRIRLPIGKKEIFLANYSLEKEEDLIIGRSFKHRVRRGETISSIARKYGVSIDLLLETNRLKRRSIIRTGQYILVNDGWSVGDKHRIRRGETVSTIAVKYNISMRQLLEANELHHKSIIRAGHTLNIPDIRKHTIRRGETIGTIARKYAVRTKDLLRANRLKKGTLIRAGRTLIIP